MNKNRFASFFTTIFGQLNWKSPEWLANLQLKAHKTPFLFWASTTLILLALVAASWGIYWYKHLPKPVYVTASITVPAITPNAETLFPNNLILFFGIDKIAESVAPIDMIGKTVTEGIDISPKIAGNWFWSNDNQLIFTPTEDWPAGQKYTIHFAKNAFAANAKLESHDFSFSTLPFEVAITGFKFYQDPVNSKVRNAVATLTFNFPVDPQSLEKNTTLMFQTEKKGNRTLSAEPVTFSYTYDENKRVAYLHSEQLKIKDVARFLRLTLHKGVSSSTGTATLKKELTKNVLIPDTNTILTVNTASASIIRNDQDRPEQVLTVETTIGVNEDEFNKSVHVYLLPVDYPATQAEKAKINYTWENPGEVTDTILALSSPLQKQTIPTEQNYSALHSFKFSAQTPRFIYIKIDKGMKGFGDFTLNRDYTAVVPVPELPKEISFLHKGSLLALSGEKKLSVLIRGLPAVKFDFARVLPANVNQLVTQTQGDFNNPYFINPQFNQQNISQIFSDIQQFDASDLSKQHYTALDLSQYLSANTNASGPQGLFLLQATGWDTENKMPLDVKASRLILITDLGMLIKDNQDGTHDVFVESITQGTPVANVTVTVLGKNGLPILSRITDAQGRVNFPSLNDFIDDRTPTVYLANLQNDVSFIPYHNDNRQLNFSKFDIGGLYTSNQELQSLSAYLFSDRGIYRPGDEVHIGIIVKQAYARPQPAGLPVQATVMDSRGTTIKEQQFILNNSGFLDLDFTTNKNSPTGQYTVNLYLVKDNLAQNFLGSTSIQVSEFQPDRMRITSNLSPKSAAGWSSPNGLTAKVSLWNLYGAPAVDRRISTKMLLNPEKIAFDEYPEYIFSDPLVDPKKPSKVFTETLADTKTNDQGEAELDLNLDRFEKATYQLTVFVEGFEADGGRSVTTQSKTLISPNPYFIGYKPDGDLSFIKQNSTRNINYIAINPQLDQADVNALKIQLVSLHPVTTLVKKSDGTYQYQSIMQSTILSTQPFTIGKQGTHYALPTQDIGEYALSVLDSHDTVLSQLKFSIVGASQKPLAKNAELSMKLNKSEYQANDDIQIQITAPYTGTGLITIERDRVYASQWFKSETTNSIQTIHIPAEFQGNGYVNVAFIRDWESPELFISPLSYSVVPFEMNHDQQDIKIDLKTPELARPGEPFIINYHTDKPGKIVVFAVDEGVLQVGNYDTPDPLAFFFQKHALEVFTQQTVDQILPKFIQDRELSAAGGDGGEAALAARLNPFKRKTDLPVVYWSGILDTDSTDRQLTYPVPDYFNGTLRVMAIAVSADSVGAKDVSATIRGNFVINPNVPTFVAPGDEFDISAIIANNIKGSGDKASTSVELTVSPEIEIIGTPTQTLAIGEGHEQTVHYKLRATSQLGSATLTFKAANGDKFSKMDATLSVRPANPFVTHIQSGQSQSSNVSLDIMQTLYPEFRQVDATLSSNPLILVFGLQRYLDGFPYGCTEQLTSKAMPLIAMNSQEWFNKDQKEINDKIATTMQMLSQRQMSNGGFSYWPGVGDNNGNHFASVYAMHFLTEAKEQSFNVPSDMFYNGISYLKTLASQNVTDLEAARIQAYAIYLLTRNEIVTSNYLANLHLYLQQDTSHAWQNDITAVYIAASYKMLKSDDDANQLLDQYKPQDKLAFNNDFYSSAIVNAQYLYLIAKHFPERLDRVGKQLLPRLVDAINNNAINTLLSGYSSLALGAYQPSSQVEASSGLSMTETMMNNQVITIPGDSNRYQTLSLATNIKQVGFINPDKQSFFYQLSQAGFDKTLAKEPLKQSMEIFREYRDSDGHVINAVPLGNEIIVHIQIRALDKAYLNNIVIEDLLPGGFEVVRDSVKNQTMDFADAREDRVNFFGIVSSTAKEIVYRIKAVNPGKYRVPPVFAESMYNPTVKARSTASEITVSVMP